MPTTTSADGRFAIASPDLIMSTRRGQLRHLAGWLIAASVVAGTFAIGVRAGWGGWSAQVLEGGTLFLAAGAYLAHVLAHHDTPRELLTKSIP
jgi:hypothetical protein